MDWISAPDQSGSRSIPVACGACRRLQHRCFEAENSGSFFWFCCPKSANNRAGCDLLKKCELRRFVCPNFRSKFAPIEVRSAVFFGRDPVVNSRLRDGAKSVDYKHVVSMRRLISRVPHRCFFIGFYKFRQTCVAKNHRTSFPRDASVKHAKHERDDNANDSIVRSIAVLRTAFQHKKQPGQSA